jgi:hypothetical protein
LPTVKVKTAIGQGFLILIVFGWYLGLRTVGTLSTGSVGPGQLGPPLSTGSVGPGQLGPTLRHTSPLRITPRPRRPILHSDFSFCWTADLVSGATFIVLTFYDQP